MEAVYSESATHKWSEAAFRCAVVFSGRLEVAAGGDFIKSNLHKLICIPPYDFFFLNLKNLILQKKSGICLTLLIGTWLDRVYYLQGGV